MTSRTKSSSSGGARAADGPPVPQGYVRSAITTSSLTATYTALLFVITVILARLLGPHAYGIYAIVISVTAIVGIFATPGLENLLIRDVAAYDVTGEHAKARALMLLSSKISIWVGLALSALLGLLAVGLHGWVLDAYSATMVIGALVIPIAALSRLRAASLVGFRRVILSRVPELVVRPVCLLALIGIGVAVGLQATPQAAMMATVAAYSLSYLVGAEVLRRVMPPAIRTARPDYDTRRWRRSAPAFLALAVTDIMNSQLSISLVGWLDSARSAGIFAVASRGAAFVALAFVGLSAVVAPRIARHWQVHEYDAVSRLLRRCSLLCAGFAVPVVIAIAILDTRLLALFGNGFREGATAFVVLAVGWMAFAVVGIYATALLMTGGENLAATTTLISLATGSVLSLVLIPPMGATGAAIAWTTGIVIAQGFVIVFWIRHRRQQILVSAAAQGV